MKQDRIELRASHDERELFSEAAAFSGMTLSAFLRQSALEKSDAILKSRDYLTLSNRDRDLFLDALENPLPNNRLQQAFNNYQKRIKETTLSDSLRKSRSRIRKNKV